MQLIYYNSIPNDSAFIEQTASTYIVSVNYHKGFRLRCYCFYFTDEQTEAQRLRVLPKFKHLVGDTDRMASVQTYILNKIPMTEF